MKRTAEKRRTDTKVLILDDDRMSLHRFGRLVTNLGLVPLCFRKSRDLIAAMPALDFHVAVINHKMPEQDGIGMVRRLASVEKYRNRPIVVVAADGQRITRIEALNSGAIDFLAKPVDALEFTAKVKNLVRLAEACSKVNDRMNWQSLEIVDAVEALRWRERELVDKLVLTSGYKDMETKRHTERVATYSATIARAYGLPEETCADIYLAAPLHDIGKVCIPDAILLKNGSLAPDEVTNMQRHAVIGMQILNNSTSPLLRLAAEIAYSHHERWDGSGYPQGLSGEDIPLSGRIVAIADVFDALTTSRPYKQAWHIEEAVDFIVHNAGKLFDPKCSGAFADSLLNIINIMRRTSDADAERPMEDASSDLAPVLSTPRTDNFLAKT